MKLFIIFFFSLVLLAKEHKVLQIDFQDAPNMQNALPYLEKKGFSFKFNKEDFLFSIHNKILYIESKKQSAVLFGMLFSKKQMVPITKVTIDWGVQQFPEGASWERGNNRLAIGLILVFGNKKLPSGIGFLAPKVPTFLAPFIGEKEKLHKRYFGKLYKNGGRYYCVSNTKGKLLHTIFEIASKYQKEFHTTPPPLSAFAFQMNTKDTTSNAKAYIKSITFYNDK
ncbi:MAG: hypothetical protein GXO11_05360 [Epsilonproteobacteria bacterium]|nr:hypothetical protein [Campylobacterota bacterium]